MNAGRASVIANFKGWLKTARANPLFLRGLAGALTVALLDQASKAWIVEIVRLQDRWKQHIELTPIFDLTYVQNYGASFGMLAGGGFSRVLLTVIALGISGWLAVWLGRLERRWAAFGAAFIIGGALGNMIDRVRLGYVVDFFDFSGLYFPWVFNVADICIDIGIGFLLLDAFLTRDKAPKSPKI